MRLAGRTRLIATSRTHNAWLKPAARRLRAQFVSRHVGAPKRRRRLPWAGFGFVALISLTAWVIASVSIWLVPVYLALMILIFAVPRGGRSSELPSRQVSQSGQVDCAAPDHDIPADQNDGVDQYPVAAVELGPEIGEPTAASRGRGLDDVSSDTVKPRRTRVRARKSARTGGEPTADSGSVTWIRVGPGKFVRADASSQAVESVPADEPTAVNEPATGADITSSLSTADGPDNQTIVTVFDPIADLTGHGPTATANAALPVEPVAPDSIEAVPTEGRKVVTGDDVSETGAGKHGIAPSAVSALTEVMSSSEGLDPVPFESLYRRAAKAETANAETETSRPGLGEHGRWLSRRVFRGRVNRNSRCFVTTIPVAVRVLSPVNKRPVPRACAPDRSPLAANVRRRQTAQGAFGRIVHVHRALRPRSPPAHFWSVEHSKDRYCVRDALGFLNLQIKKSTWHRRS